MPRPQTHGLSPTSLATFAALALAAFGCGRFGYNPLAIDGDASRDAAANDGALADAPSGSCTFDDFNDGLADNWTVVSGTWAAEINVYSHDDLLASKTMTLTGGSVGDLVVEVDGMLVSDCVTCGDILRLVFRYVDADNWSAVFLSRYYGTAGVEQWIGGNRSFGEVAASPGFGVWHPLGAIVSGARVDLVVDGTPTYSNTVPDGTVRGRVGLSTDRAHAHFDNLTATNCH